MLQAMALAASHGTPVWQIGRGIPDSQDRPPENVAGLDTAYGNEGNLHESNGTLCVAGSHKPRATDGRMSLHMDPLQCGDFWEKKEKDIIRQ